MYLVWNCVSDVSDCIELIVTHAPMFLVLQQMQYKNKDIKQKHDKTKTDR